MPSKHLINNAFPGADGLGTIVDQLITLVNELKADFNAHRTQAGVHSASDTANVVAAADISAIGE